MLMEVSIVVDRPFELSLTIRIEEYAEQLTGSRRRRYRSGINGAYPGSSPLIDNSPLVLEKSNVMMFGPSGSGKTLMVKYEYLFQLIQ